VQEILSSVQTFPPHLRLADQGLFAIGYYHQMRDFYSRSSASADGSTN
jgi:CRISPR-associated protein Csd1